MLENRSVYSDMELSCFREAVVIFKRCPMAIDIILYIG